MDAEAPTRIAIGEVLPDTATPSIIAELQAEGAVSAIAGILAEIHLDSLCAGGGADARLSGATSPQPHALLRICP